MANEKNTWTVTVGDDVIKVSDEGLFVNDKLQDVSYGITLCAKYYGKLPNGKEVKAVIGAEGFGFKYIVVYLLIANAYLKIKKL